MKSFIALCGALCALASPAHASFNTDGIRGPVTCVGQGLTVTINAARTAYLVRTNGHSGVYRVTGQDSDGDTRIDRPGVLPISGTVSSNAVLTFSDEGDQLLLDGRTFGLRCPN
jgi:hypothetical protein